MKRRDLMKEKARQNFEDSLKEKCIRCGKWDILNEYELCDGCEEGGNDEGFGGYAFT